MHTISNIIECPQNNGKISGILFAVDQQDTDFLPSNEEVAMINSLLDETALSMDGFFNLSSPDFQPSADSLYNELGNAPTQTSSLNIKKQKSPLTCSPAYADKETVSLPKEEAPSRGNFEQFLSPEVHQFFNSNSNEQEKESTVPLPEEEATSRGNFEQFLSPEVQQFFNSKSKEQEKASTSTSSHTMEQTSSLPSSSPSVDAESSGPNDDDDNTYLQYLSLEVREILNVRSHKEGETLSPGW